MSSFKELGLSPAMQANLDRLNYTQPTGIQVKAMPPAMAGRDVIAMAQTGSGKTAAFGIPCVAVCPLARRLVRLATAPILWWAPRAGWRTTFARAP